MIQDMDRYSVDFDTIYRVHIVNWLYILVDMLVVNRCNFQDTNILHVHLILCIDCMDRMVMECIDFAAHELFCINFCNGKNFED